MKQKMALKGKTKTGNCNNIGGADENKKSVQHFLPLSEAHSRAPSSG
jgi:hypothetical protein